MGRNIGVGGGGRGGRRGVKAESWLQHHPTGGSTGAALDFKPSRSLLQSDRSSSSSTTTSSSSGSLKENRPCSWRSNGEVVGVCGGVSSGLELSPLYPETDELS